MSRDVAQTLSGVKLGLSNMENDLTKLEHGEELSQYYSELKESVNQALASTNNLIYLYGSELLVEHELIDSIETILNLHVTPTGIAAHLDAEDFDEDLLSPDIIQCLFNIAHQALENVIEHSEARNVYVGLSTSNDRAVMVINDDGKGFSARDLTLEDQPCFGFSGMSERLAMCNGSFLVTSQKGNGTKVTAIIPLCETEGCL